MLQNKGYVQFLLNPDIVMAEMTGWVLLGYSVKQREEDWLLVIKVNTRLQGRMVAFISTTEYKDLFELWYTEIAGDKVTLRLRPDRFG